MFELKILSGLNYKGIAHVTKAKAKNRTKTVLNPIHNPKQLIRNSGVKSTETVLSTNIPDGKGVKFGNSFIHVYSSSIPFNKLNTSTKKRIRRAAMTLGKAGCSHCDIKLSYPGGVFRGVISLHTLEGKIKKAFLNTKHLY